MKADYLLYALNGVQTLFAVPILARKWKLRRGFKTEFSLARFFGPRLASPHSVRLVMVGRGFVEARWALALGRLLREKRPDVEIIWAIFDPVSVTLVGGLPEGQIMVAPPFDYAPAAALWLHHAAPDTLIFLEKFLYPNFARVAHNRKLRVGAITARLRDHRGGRYAVGAFYNRWLLSSFDLVGLRSEQERVHLGELSGAGNVKVTGSLKYPPRIAPLTPERVQELNLWIGDALGRPLLAAGSTREGDESWVLEAFLPLAKRGARLLLAPRQSGRVDEVEALCRDHNFTTTRRSLFSTSQPQTHAPDVWILDTVGELSTTYAAASAAFIGGTLKHTGQNVLEPLIHGVPVCFGPKRGTFGAEQDIVLEKEAGFRVASPAELTQAWTRALDDEEWRTQVRLRGLEVAAERDEAWQTTLDALLELLPPPL